MSVRVQFLFVHVVRGVVDMLEGMNAASRVAARWKYVAREELWQGEEKQQ